jgi:pectinesterase
MLNFSKQETAMMRTGKITISVCAATILSALTLSAQQAASPGSAKTIRVVVAADGSGNFTTIQQAIDHAPPEGDGRLIVAIRPGVYHERVIVPKDRPRVTFLGLGNDPSATVITYNMSAAAAGGTFLSSTVDVEGSKFEASNITFANTYGPGSQAVALMIHSDRAVFRHCHFTGWQDTLYAASGRQYYKDCTIEGAVDFIFGNATAVFDHCVINVAGRGYITAQSRVTPDGTTGYVFYHCRLTGKNVSADTFLGRPWRPYARVVYIDCWMGNEIRPEGWDNWRNPANEKTAWFAEYGSTGPGADSAARVAWAHALTAAQIKPFEPEAFLRGDDGWNPVAP